MTRVLIVDDKDDNLYYLRVLLQAHGCQVVEARHGAEALVLARQSPPDIVIADLLMPIMDGYTLLRHWKADASLSRIPFVVYTATYTETEDERLAYDLGADGFILKPAEPDAFVSKVRTLVDRASDAVAPPRTPDANEADVLKVYSETLIRKLEEKTLQLEESNRALQRDLAERLRVEAERQSLLHALGERVKELHAMRAAATLLQDTRAPIETLLTQLAALLPPAFQYPEITAARVRIDGAASATSGFRVTPWVLAARFETNDGTDGCVEVAYLEERPAGHSGPFLAEEVDLLQSLADMLRSHVERRRAEDAQRASQAMLRTASRMARLGAWTIERSATHVVWSSELREILEGGDGPAPTLDEGLALYAPEYRDAVTAAVRAALTDGTPFDLEVAIDTMKGRRLWVRVSGEAERAPDGRVLRLRGALQDLTDRKNLEQQFLRSQRIESIGTLAGGIAHDLNNVLAPIVLSAEMLKMSVDDPLARELIAAIETSARRGADMVRQVLTFARGVGGQRVSVPIDEVVRELERIANDTFLKSIRVRTDLPPDLPPVVGDRTQLHQVLLNLCVNARDAMPDGGVLSLSAKPVVVHATDTARHPDARPGTFVMVQVEDTGTGMPPSTLDRIFEPFFTTKEPGKGTGLGLSTSLAIVRSHQGFLDVNSAPGRGTRFRVYLPVALAPSPPSAATQTPPPRGRGERILVVDDEDLVRDMIAQTLEAYGYRTVLARDGAEAVRIYTTEAGAIAAVITDMMMPVMDGAATIDALTAIDPGVRIIGTSGLSLDGQPLKGGTTRRVRFLAKPYATETLLVTLHDVLRTPPG